MVKIANNVLNFERRKNGEKRRYCAAVFTSRTAPLSVHSIDRGHSSTHLEVPSVQLLEAIVLSRFLSGQQQRGDDPPCPQVARVMVHVSQKLVMSDLLGHNLSSSGCDTTGLRRQRGIHIDTLIKSGSY